MDTRGSTDTASANSHYFMRVYRLKYLRRDVHQQANKTHTPQGICRNMELDSFCAMMALSIATLVNMHFLTDQRD